MKKYFLKFLFLFLFGLNTSISSFETNYELEFFDDLANLDDSMLSRQPTDCVPDQQIINDLLEIGAPGALMSNLYCVTFPPNVRDVIRLPSTYLYFDRTCDWGVSFNFFYNQMLKVYFTANSPFLKSYLNIEEPDFLEEIDISFLTEVDIPELFPLFTNIKLQERRAGVMLGANKKYQGWSFSFILPFYWIEHNFFLTDAEQDAIANEPIFAGAGAGNSERDITAFFLKHVVATKFGVGDFALVVDNVIAQSDCSELTVGFRFVAPTAGAIDGCRSELWFGDILLFGGRYCKTAPIPPLDIAELFRLKLCCPDDEIKMCDDQIVEIGKNFLIGALDRLTANVADRPLGQEHFSLGPIATYEYNFSPKGGIISRAILEYFFPKYETRLFLRNQNPQDFARNYTDEAQAASNLAFLNQQLVNFFYPEPACVKVHPGISAEWSIALTYNASSLHGELGYDLWFQGVEHISPNKNTAHLNLAKGTKPWAYQSKVFGKLFGDCNNWHIGVQADVTVDSRGIGKDMTASIDYTWDF